MTQIEQIKAEIERLKKELYKQQDVRIDGSPIPVFDINAIDGMLKILEEIKGFINSLPIEQPSEELEEEINSYSKESLALKFPTTDKKQIKADIEYIARHFANWQKEQTINKACEWLRQNTMKSLVLSSEDENLTKEFIEDFKKAMED